MGKFANFVCFQRLKFLDNSINESRSSSMKKVIVLFVIVLLAAPVFAQQSWQGNRQFAVNVSFMPMVEGISLGGFGFEGAAEFAPIRPFSVRASFRYVGFDAFKQLKDTLDYFTDIKSSLDIYHLRFALEGRWYPSKKYIHGFFLNGGFQFDRLSLSAQFKYEKVSIGVGGGLNTYGLLAGLGYKGVFGSSRVAFSIEPAINFVWPLSSDIPFKEISDASGGAGASAVLGWMLGMKLVRAGLRFGVAF